MNERSVKLNIKYKGNLRILQFKRQFNWIVILCTLFSYALLIQLYPSIREFSVFIALIIFPIAFLYPHFFGEKIIWIPKTKELVVKSFKYKISPSSLISFSKEEKIAYTSNFESFQFKLVDKEQGLALPLFTKFSFNRSEVQVLKGIGNQLSRILKLPFFIEPEIMGIVEKSSSYLDRLHSDSEFIKPPPNSFVSHKMLGSLALPESLSHCVTFSEKLANTVLDFEGASKKRSLRTFVVFGLVIISMVLMEIAIFAINQASPEIYFSLFAILLGICIVVLLIVFLTLVFLHFGIFKANRASLTIGHRSIIVLNPDWPTERIYKFSLDKLRGIDLVSTANERFSIKFHDDYLSKDFGKFKKEEAEQLKNFIDTVICKQYHENRVVQDEELDSTNLATDKAVTQSDSEVSRSSLIDPVAVQSSNVSASLSNNRTNKIDGILLEKKLASPIKVEETAEFTRVTFDKVDLNDHRGKLMWFTLICFFGTFYLIRIAVTGIPEIEKSYLVFVVPFSIMILGILVGLAGVLVIRKTNNHFLYIDNSGVEHRRHIIGFEKRILKAKFEELEQIEIIYPQLNEKHHSLQLVDNQSTTTHFGKFTQEEAEFVKEYLRMLIFEAHDINVTSSL